MKDKEGYDLFISLIKREGYQEYIKYLKDNTDYYGAPASTKYHNSYEGGLLDHCVSVTRIMIKLAKILAPELSLESIVLVGMHHDDGKYGIPGNPLYIKNTNSYPKQPYIQNTNKQVQLSHAAEGLYMITQFVKLTPEEYQAILHHDLHYIPDNTFIKNKEGKLLMLLHYADNWSAKFEEDRGIG